MNRRRFSTPRVFSLRRDFLSTFHKLVQQRLNLLWKVQNIGHFLLYRSDLDFYKQNNDVSIIAQGFDVFAECIKNTIRHNMVYSIMCYIMKLKVNKR